MRLLRGVLRILFVVIATYSAAHLGYLKGQLYGCLERSELDNSRLKERGISPLSSGCVVPTVAILGLTVSIE